MKEKERNKEKRTKINTKGRKGEEQYGISNQQSANRQSSNQPSNQPSKQASEEESNQAASYTRHILIFILISRLL